MVTVVVMKKVKKLEFQGFRIQGLQPNPREGFECEVALRGKKINAI